MVLLVAVVGLGLMGSSPATSWAASSTVSFAQGPGSPIQTGGASPQSTTSADFDKDGFPDLAVANALSNDVTVLLGNGSGGFSPATGSPFPTGGTSPRGITSADFNGDGKPDLAVPNANTNDVTVLLNTTNFPPVTNDDSYSTNQDRPLNVPAPGVLANDTDPNTPANMTAVKVTDPTNGTLTLNSDGSFTYTPNPGFSGSDSFTYKAKDGTAEGNTATVTITVKAAPSPVARPNFYTGDEDKLLTVPKPGVLKNDTGTSPLTAKLVSKPTHGTLSLNANGAFNYKPDANFHGIDTFTYRASHGTSASNIAKVTIKVNALDEHKHHKKPKKGKGGGGGGIGQSSG